MDRDTALRLLRLDASATPDEVESAFRRLTADLRGQIAAASAEAHRSEYRTAHDELERAVDTLRASDASQTVDRATADPVPRSHHLSLPAGRVLAGRYEIRRRLGAGELGATFVALDRERGVEIALRVFAPDLLEVPGVTERLIGAVDAAREINHPGIVDVHAVARDEALLLVTTALPYGTTLRREMDAHAAAGHRFPVDEVVHIAVSLCAALGHAHPRRVHGGVKPENIFLCDDGTVKLADFGIDASIETGASSRIGVSRRQVVYLAPEQLKGAADIDHRADQYATAAVLYEMLTQQPPVGRVISASRKDPEIPVALSQALDRALAAEPSDRFADMSAFALALAKGAASSTRRTWRWVATLVLLLLIAAGVTMPRWRGAVSSAIESVLRDPNAETAAGHAREQALAAASTWRKLAESQSPRQHEEDAALADAAFSAGEDYFAVMDYERAAESFQLARELYESLETAVRLLQDEPAKAAQSAKDLFEQLKPLERVLYGRAAGAFVRVQRCEKSLVNARADEERNEIETRCRDAHAELALLNRLKTLTHAHVLDPSLRGPIADALREADRLVAEGRRQAALSAQAECATLLERLLAWPEQAEAALRDEAAVVAETDRVRSAMGRTALQLEDVQSALGDAEAQIAAGREKLEAGQVSEARERFEAARVGVAGVSVRAVKGLLAQAEFFEADGRPAAAMQALHELFAIEPDHAASRELASRIVTHRLTNSIGMELIFIPPGTFTMGSPLDEPGRDDDEGFREVEIARGFYMGATEVTQAQWSAVTGANPSGHKGDDLPVEQVTWDEALAFCRTLGEREGRIYRLPTEEEWEYACRAGATTPFSFGETISSDQANYDGEGVYGGGVKGVFRNETVPVGTFPPNAWGLHDMHGSVWEWCPDSRKDYPPSPVRRPDEAAPIEGRILRGGSWRSRPRYCRCANRVREMEGAQLDIIGLRVVLESE